MANFKKRAALTLAGAVAIAGSLFSGGTAMAASSPIAACGGGSYHTIDSHDLGKATIYLLYNGSTNCVVTWKDSPNKTHVYAAIRSESSGPKADAGNFQIYAGPVKVKAPGECITWGGGYASKKWTSGWEHCG